MHQRLILIVTLPATKSERLHMLLLHPEDARKDQYMGLHLELLFWATRQTFPLVEIHANSSRWRSGSYRTRGEVSTS